MYKKKIACKEQKNQKLMNKSSPTWKRAGDALRMPHLRAGDAHTMPHLRAGDAFRMPILMSKIRKRIIRLIWKITKIFSS